MANTLAYYDTGTITAVKSFIVQAPGGNIFCCVRPIYERVVSDLDRSMHRSLWALVAHSSFIEGSQMTKNTASVAAGMGGNSKKNYFPLL